MPESLFLNKVKQELCSPFPMYQEKHLGLVKIEKFGQEGV